MERKSISRGAAALAYVRTNASQTAPFLSLPPGTEIVVYVAFSPLPESTECAKVIAALDSRRIEYSLEVVPTDFTQRKRVLPRSGIAVPVLVLNRKIDSPVQGSDAILRHLDEQLTLDATERFFSEDGKTYQQQRMQCQMINKVLGMYVKYFSWVHESSSRKSLPRETSCFGCCSARQMPSELEPVRQSISIEVRRDLLRVHPSLAMDSEGVGGTIRDALVALLVELTSVLALDTPCQLPGAAHFSLYVQLERLIGSLGDANLPSCMPELKGVSTLASMWGWHEFMTSEYPIRFTDKMPYHPYSPYISTFQTKPR